jgi:hypothetical protein
VSISIGVEATCVRDGGGHLNRTVDQATGEDASGVLLAGLAAEGAPREAVEAISSLDRALEHDAVVVALEVDVEDLDGA